MVQIIECPVCGKTMEINTADKGRPRIYCSKICANIEKYYSFCMDKLSKTPMTPEARKHWKGRLFSDRNQVFKEGKF